MLTQATGPPPNHAQQGNPAGQPLNGSAEAGTGTTRICERGRLGFSGVSVIAAITTRYMPSYTVPAAKMGHAEVVFDVGMVFPAGAVTMRQWPFRAGTTCVAGSHLARLVHGMRLQERLHRCVAPAGARRGAHHGLHRGPVEHHDQLVGELLRVSSAAALGLQIGRAHV